MIESPVCTPIGSTFSIEHTITALSAPSRITSSSNSFHPTIDSSTRTSLTGLLARALAAAVASSARSCANPLPPPPERERGPKDQGIAELVAERERLIQRVRYTGARDIEPGAQHGLLELAAVLRLADRLERRTEHAHAEPIEIARLGQGDAHVQPRLPAQGRQQRVGLLPLEHLQDRLGRERLDVGAIGETRVGHDRRGVRVDQRHLEALGAQHLACLGPGVVELAGLADHDRARADDHDLVQVGAPGHQRDPPISVRNSSNR